uniref:cholesterol 7-alpha-monooxygenase-like n=1 Tax=Ciona intestinalis TaxID=7719 RepID=UPI00089DB962|nr:cholesterol 7-alpha-monooxygenase-like [Ciona intestinalis]XP_026695812.1 cholesterol 7-alpha-monooxygenase-like [Ciona intestinalis]XP_026695813.1 cholesterol 7-alpha-monooxygenase-like [Ciona intestinalis]|eukprot:XP_018672581.1 cholesterol 7-alpha-monooxygenase-like [Ciona intestinalis]
MFWTLALVILNVVCYSIYRNRRRRRAGEPPLVSHWIPFIGSALDFGKAPLEYLQSLQKRLGDVFTIKLAGWNVHVFMNPHDVPNLERAKNIDHKNVIGDFVSRMVGDEHMIHNPARHSDAVPKILESTLRSTMHLMTLCDSCTNVLPKTIKRTLKSEFNCKRETKIGLYELCKKLVSDMTLNLFFGSIASDEKCNEETKQICEEFFVYFKSSALLVDRIPIHLLPATKKSRGRLFELLSRFDFENRDNVSELIKKVAAVGSSEEKVRHLLIILWSAQANTLPALFWTLFYILNDKTARIDVLEEFEKHLRKTVPACDVIGTVTDDLKWPNLSDIQRMRKGDVDKLVLLDSCTKETMRMTGSSLAARRAHADTTVTLASGQEYKIRKGDYTSYFAPVTHQDADIYDKPEEYRHKRFLQHDDKDPSMLKSRTQFSKNGKRISPSTSIMTFGYGAVRCPGRHIALMEIKFLTLVLLRHFDIKLVKNYSRQSEDYPQFDLTHLGFGVMPPSRDVDVTLSI